MNLVPNLARKNEQFIGNSGTTSKTDCPPETKVYEVVLLALIIPLWTCIFLYLLLMVVVCLKRIKCHIAEDSERAQPHHQGTPSPRTPVRPAPPPPLPLIVQSKTPGPVNQSGSKKDKKKVEEHVKTHKTNDGTPVHGSSSAKYIKTKNRNSISQYV